MEDNTDPGTDPNTDPNTDPRTSLDDLVQRLSALLPSGFSEMRGDLEKNFKGVLQAAFARMDLVTREEFDVQRAVLARTREKLEALEAQLQALTNEG